MKKATLGLAMAALLCLVGTAGAATFTAPDGTQDWDNDDNWDTTYPDAVGAAAAFPEPSGGGSQNIDLNIEITVGTITFTNTGDTINLNVGTSGSLVFDNSGSGAMLTMGSRGNNINVDVTLDDDLTVDWAEDTSGNLKITGVISGAGKTLTKKGDGRLDLDPGDVGTALANVVIEAGDLTIDDGGVGSANVALQAGSFRMSQNGTYSNSVSLEGNAMMGSAGNRSVTYDGTITESGGSYQVTWRNERSSTPSSLSTSLTIGAANDYSGGTVVSHGSSNLWSTDFAADGCVGSGDVTLEDENANIRIVGGTTDTIADTASLYLTNAVVDLGEGPVTKYSLVQLDEGVNETIGGLYFDGVAQALGTWGATGSGATYTNNDYFRGTGVLNVVPEPATMVMLGLGGVGLLIRRRRRS